MLQYILECVAFQLVFLIIYDLFLKRETFFQWNRCYLIGAYIISMVLPWIKIEALKTNAPTVFQGYSEFLWNMNDATIVSVPVKESFLTVSWEYMVLFGGMGLAMLFFGYKLFQIYQLRKKGEVHYFEEFTRIVILNSSVVFSFFKSIFLGDKVLAKEHQSIIGHELVHIRERHSYDLLFFELMRIVGWFNPLVYVYQSRVSELHEFIADAKVVKTQRKKHYEFLLAQVFQTQNISFINQFFKSSLIKKRIVMLQKSKSNRLWKLKYLLLVPMVFGMLAYTSSTIQQSGETNPETNSEDAQLIAEIESEIEEEVLKYGSPKKIMKNFTQKINKVENYILTKREFFKVRLLNKRNLDNLKVEFEDDVKPRKKIPKLPLPSTFDYTNYYNREVVFKTMDENLRVSINQKQLDVRVVKRNPYKFAAGTYVDVKNVADLSGEEIKRINRAIDELTSDNELLFISDNTNSFVVSRRPDSQKDFTKKNLEKMFEQLQNERNRLLMSKDENYPIIVNLDQQLRGLRKAISSYSETVPFAKVDEVPIFPGCEDADDLRACFQQKMIRHISKNFNYPKEAQEKGVQGRVSLLFTINQEGLVQNLKLRGPDVLLENEAKRIVMRLPKMSPGKHKGEVVGVIYSIPITFKLDSGEKDISENEVSVQGVPFGIVDEVPVFPGCEGDENKRSCFNTMMQKHISKNFNYPKEAQEKGIQGRVNIMFTIGEDGVVKNLRMRGPHKLLEDEARRIIMRLPDMKPGRHEGENVNVPFSIPISFKLQDDAKSPDLMRLISKKGLDPVYYIDGKESSKEAVNKLNPDDIESMSVLKGDAAKNVSGEKSKNGVVLIITKKKD